MKPFFSYENRILVIIMIVSFLAPFTSSALTLSLPDIGIAYGVGESLLSWVLEIFLISSTIFVLPLGKAADILGKRKVFLVGILSFTVSSAAVFWVHSIEELLFLRFIQGIGSAMIYATSMAIIVLVYPQERRGKAMGLVIAAVYIGLSAGPVLGGFLNYYYTWKSIFLFIAVCSTVAAILTFGTMKTEWISDKGGRIDYKGSFEYAAALVMIMYGLSEILDSFSAKYFLAAGVGVFAFFIRNQMKTAKPLLPVRLFLDNRVFSYSSFAAMLNYSATFAISFLLSLYLQNIMQYTSRDAGIILLVQPILMALLSPAMGALSDRVSISVLASGGMACIALGLAGLALSVPWQSIYAVMLCLVIIGGGFSLFTAPNNNAIMSAVPKSFYGTASSVLGTVRLIGQVFSVAIVTLVLSRTSTENVMGNELLMENIRFAFFVFTILCVIGIFPSMKRTAGGK
ncbi:MFS transporter [Megasphaera paucivorans]|uniref:Drug resistance transporter, EmrB/QacA subfamily n=1 Tax=Megasphaera paucivorans TaxID=349095 RepID=A0A1H0BVY5_9FIRM|nr:MFS transporter [Megasphaera paucivorans]SDN49756.1 drug resistance transporter, EmrB/QacA subfamily [Megasphaera paucivorans]